ncbi:hypothetical protein [Streptomyces netropsis]|uniref:Uncharacterized protein n=1 Tax=Streptomyces netropsis TaxID=55404 RepID=A0A7W7L8C9_STRNE|nr:hypothetical protein [Streptomyces netropsis]MBB4885519.1 hypothetical protein [Streptomyces netropsis]GGR38725.1 hypothetical protein GCM10010219_49850 [Streptomyces netropsis]
MTADDGLFAAMGGCTVLDCRVRVIRTDGWSWGPEPSALARGAVALLPHVVEEYLAGALSGPGVPLAPAAAGAAAEEGGPPRDVEVTGPVRIKTYTTLGELTAAAPPAHPDTTAGEPGRGGPDPVSLPRPDGLPPPPPVAIREAGPAAPAPDAASPGGPRAAPASAAADRDRVLVGLLLEASRCGAFDTVLARLPHASLLLLLRALESAGKGAAAGPVEGATGRTPPPGGPGEAEPGAGPGKAVGPAPSTPAGPEAIAAGLLAALGDEPPRSASPVPAGAAPDATGPERPPGAPPSAMGRPGPVPSADGGARPYGPGTGPASGSVTEIDRALPFLLLPPLRDRGYLQAVSAVLAGGGAEAPDGAAFATALAHKVLPPPAHGWLHAPRDVHAAAVFAGITTGPAHPAPGAADVSAADLERRLGPLLALLDARLGLQAAQGRTTGNPLLLRAVAEDRLLLLDVDGLYPVWDAARPRELLRFWELAGRPVVLLPARPHGPATASGGGLTTALDALGITFVTDLPPFRHEGLSRVPGPRRCWTNGGGPGVSPHSVGDDALIGAARRLTYEASRAARFTEALIDLRPGVRAGRAPALERTVTLAASCALADLAWQLWSDREPTDPVCALDRFADLGARVFFHDGTVEVRLPLGPRHADLYRHRLLPDVPDVPWLGGRTVVFTGG